MGLFDRFKRNKTQAAPARTGPRPSQPEAPSAWTPGGRHATPRRTAPQPQPAPRRAPATATPPNRTSGWVPAGQPVSIAGYTIQNGLLYVGQGLSTQTAITEPSLINPRLPVDTRRPDLAGATMGYWPSYDEITPSARAAYLSWLAGGRRAPDVGIGYVFLFLYGLERRVLVDIARDPALRPELSAIRSEVSRLLAIYDWNGSFRGYASSFLDVLDVLTSDGTAAQVPPLTQGARWKPPAALVVTLASHADAGRPLPADWALAWAWYHPEMRVGVTATRCLEELRALFALRYTEKYGDGLVLKPVGKRARLEYRAASAGIRSAVLSTDLPDVFGQKSQAKKIITIADAAMTELDPFGRYLGRNPEGRGTLAAAAMLPAELLGEATGEVKALRDWAARHAESGEVATGRELMELWPTKTPTRMGKPETVALAQLLGRFGFGVEPDARLGGPAISPDTPIVAFETGPEAPHIPTAAYAAATTLLHLAVAVSAADGHTSPAEHDHLVSHLESSLHLTAGERVRLEAHLRWLTANEIKLTGLKRRIEALTMPQRDSVADLLIAVAAADGVISPDEVTSLTKIFKLLELDPALVHTRLHAHLTGASRPAPATGPVTVRPAGTPDAGYPITPPRDGASAEPAIAATGVALDLAAIEAKFAETAEVSALLTDIFTDDDHHEGQPGGVSAATQPGRHAADLPAEASLDAEAEEPSIAGLDLAHSRLVRILATQDNWSMPELEEHAAALGLMPAGALDRINEASLDAVEEPFLDEDDPDTFIVNDYARQELAS
jgi:tellurite resistance protein